MKPFWTDTSCPFQEAIMEHCVPSRNNLHNPVLKMRKTYCARIAVCAFMKYASNENVQITVCADKEPAINIPLLLGARNYPKIFFPPIGIPKPHFGNWCFKRLKACNCQNLEKNRSSLSWRCLSSPLRTHNTWNNDFCMSRKSNKWRLCYWFLSRCNLPSSQ